MKNIEQLLNKENWIKYLKLADKGGITNHGIAQDIVSKIGQAINYSQCCTKLKDKPRLNFEDWYITFGYTKRFDNVFTKRGVKYSEYAVRSMYKTEYLQNL